MDTRHERTSPLDQVFPTGLGRGKEGGDQRKRERKGAREKESTFSLDFSAISPSNPSETKSKVDPSLQELRVGINIVEFRQTPGGRGFLLLVLFLG